MGRQGPAALPTSTKEERALTRQRPLTSMMIVAIRADPRFLSHERLSKNHKAVG